MKGLPIMAVGALLAASLGVASFGVSEEPRTRRKREAVKHLPEEPKLLTKRQLRRQRAKSRTRG